MTLSVYQATVTNASGDILPSADIEVILESTGLPATIYSTRAGAALANPFASDANGFAQFYADAGEYKITATSGLFSRVWRYVRLGDGGSIDTGTDSGQVPLNINIVYPADTVAELRAFEPSLDFQQASVKNSGTFFYNPASTESDDGEYVLVTPLGKRWVANDRVRLKNNSLEDTNAAFDNAVVLQRTAANSVPRVYAIPNGTPAGNTKSAVKVFFDDFVSDPSNYRDFNVTCTHGFNGGVVSNDDGDDSALLLNMKTLGSYRKQAPDVVFCYNDAVSTADIGGRMVQFFDDPTPGIRLTRWIFGKGTTFLSPTSDIAYFEGNLAIQHLSGLRMEGSDGVGDTTINRLNASNELEDNIRNGFTFVRDQYGRMQQGLVNTETFSAPFAASKTFSARDGGYQKMFLTADMTIASIGNVIDGDEITLHLTSDASNRVVTWPAAWLTSSASITVNASTTSIIKFRYDGTTMVQQSLEITLT